MPRGSLYGSKESDLGKANQTLLRKYRKFQDVLRRRRASPLDAPSVAEYRRTFQHKEISAATQKELTSELLRYHGWACTKLDRPTHRVSFAVLLLSFKRLYSYCQFLKRERRVKEWTMNKICQAIIGMLKFVRLEVKSFKTSDVDSMLSETRGLYKNIARSAQISMNERPSLCERRERGEALAFLDIVKVCEVQFLRVKALKNVATRSITTAIRAQLGTEVLRLAVLVTLLKYPARKVEAQRFVVESAGETWRLKLSAKDRKSGRFPINVKLSNTEVEMFKLLWNSATEMDVCDCSVTTVTSWKPFEGIELTEILKSTTTDMTGVGVTVTDLRSAAESHVDTISYGGKKNSANIQKSLSYAEGHSDRTAKMFYKRNGSTTTMRAWTSYIDTLMKMPKPEAGDERSAIDMRIVGRINASQKLWAQELRSKIQRARTSKKALATQMTPTAENRRRKKRVLWSAEEDEGLRNGVRLHGCGSWKAILENSPILQERYRHVPVTKAREGLKDHWRNTLSGSKTEKNSALSKYAALKARGRRLNVENVRAKLQKRAKQANKKRKSEPAKEIIATKRKRPSLDHPRKKRKG